MAPLEASLFRLLLAALGFYLLLKAVGWIARRLLAGPRTDLHRQQRGRQAGGRRSGRPIHEEDIQDARYKDIDADP